MEDENSKTGETAQAVEDNNRKEREEREGKEGEFERRRQIWEKVGPVF